jgi:hypothetical protein
MIDGKWYPGESFLPLGYDTPVETEDEEEEDNKNEIPGYPLLSITIGMAMGYLALSKRRNG